jgi:UDPglucose 6-dehydrogenase
MAVIADRCPQVQVTVVDLIAERIAAWNDPDLAQLQVYEPGLDAVVGRARGRNLHFSTAVEEAIANADMVFISVNTLRFAMGSPAGVADAALPRRAPRLITLAEVHQLALGPQTVQHPSAATLRWRLHRGDAGRVVAPVFQLAQALDQQWCR